MAAAPNETFQRLWLWEYGQTLSERLAAQILANDGYEHIDPIHPRGGPDGGKDAIAIRKGQRWIMAVYFASGGRSYSEISRKAVADAAGVAKNAAYGMVFVTNQQLSEAERRSLATAVGVPLDLFHIERLVLSLDAPSMHGIRRQYLSIDYGQVGSHRMGPTEAQLLDAALGAASTRRLQRLRAAGITDERRTQVEDWMARNPRPALQIPAGQRLVLLSAPMGYGKTELAHDWFTAHVREAIASPSAPFPLWLRARDVRGTFEIDVVERLGRDIIHEIGSAVVLDGLDELAPVDAVNLIEAAEEFCGAWPKVAVLATAKPEPSLEGFLVQTVEKWSIQDGHALAQEVAGTRLPHDWWTDEVAEALKTPLLAVALGVRAASGGPPPASRSALIQEIAEQSMRAARVAPSTAVTKALISIAAHPLATGNPFPASQLDPDLLAQIRATPLIIETAQHLSFALPVLELVYAARGLTTGEVSFAEAASSSHFLQWRYALAMAVDAGNPIEADHRLGEIAAANPLAASWVLEAIISKTPLHSADLAYPEPLELRHEIMVADPNIQLSPQALVLLRQLRDAHRVWITGMGPLGSQLAGASGGVIPGWTANADGSRMLIGKRATLDGIDLHGTAMPANFFRLPDGLMTSNTHVSVGPQPTGRLARWTWTRNDLRTALKARMKRFTLASDPAGPLAAERAWNLAQSIVHGGGRYNHLPIPVDDVLRRISEQLALAADAVHATFQVTGGYYTKDDLIWIRGWINAHAVSGSEMTRPAPRPDRLPGGGWTWSVYTGQQMHRLILWVLHAAAEGYSDLVTRNFPDSGSTLDHMAMSPLHIIGELVTAADGAKDGGFESGPVLNYTITSAPPGATDPIVDVTHSIHGDSPRDDIDFAQYDRWTSAALHIEGAMPATQWAYHWLIDDLVAVGWLDQSWYTFL